MMNRSSKDKWVSSTVPWVRVKIQLLQVPLKKVNEMYSIHARYEKQLVYLCSCVAGWLTALWSVCPVSFSTSTASTILPMTELLSVWGLDVLTGLVRHVNPVWTADGIVSKLLDVSPELCSTVFYYKMHWWLHKDDPVMFPWQVTVLVSWWSALTTTRYISRDVGSSSAALWL